MVYIILFLSAKLFSGYTFLTFLEVPPFHNPPTVLCRRQSPETSLTGGLNGVTQEGVSKCTFWIHPRRRVRMAKMQGAENEDAGSVLKYMTKPESDSNEADWLLGCSINYGIRNVQKKVLTF